MAGGEFLSHDEARQVLEVFLALLRYPPSLLPGLLCEVGDAIARENEVVWGLARRMRVLAVLKGRRDE